MKKTEESGQIFSGTTIQVEETKIVENTNTIYGTDSQTSEDGYLLDDNGGNNQTSNSQANRMQDSQTSEDGSLLDDTGGNDQTSDSQTTRMPDSQTSDDGSLLDYNGEGGHVLYWQLLGGHKTECALCGTSFDLIEDDNIYCLEGCPDEALERSANSGQSDSQAIKATIVNDETKIFEITTETTNARSRTVRNVETAEYARSVGKYADVIAS